MMTHNLQLRRINESLHAMESDFTYLYIQTPHAQSSLKQFAEIYH